MVAAGIRCRAAASHPSAISDSSSPPARPPAPAARRMERDLPTLPSVSQETRTEATAIVPSSGCHTTTD